MDEQPLTSLLQAWRAGDPSAEQQILPIVYDQLRRMAASYLRGERPGHTLAPTALVHEAYLRLVGTELSWQDRAHFYAMAATMMRRILVDHAKQRSRQKRGGHAQHVPLDEAFVVSPESEPLILAIDEALGKLQALDPRRARIIELLFFGGLTWEETGEALQISQTTLHRELRLAKAWIRHEIEGA